MYRIMASIALSLSSTACMNLNTLRDPETAVRHTAYRSNLPAYAQAEVPPADDHTVLLQVTAGVALAAGVILYVND